jgi:hypothetical protein
MPVEHRTRALILRTFDQGESDRVVHLYTAAVGRQAIAKGARRSSVASARSRSSRWPTSGRRSPRAQLMRSRTRGWCARAIPLRLRYAIACQFLELLNRSLLSAAAGAVQLALGVLDADQSEPDAARAKAGAR